MRVAVEGAGGNVEKRDEMQKYSGFTWTVDGVLEEIMSNSGPHLWEKQLLEVLKQYDDKDCRKRVNL